MKCASRLLLAVAISLALAGCTENMWWEYRDDPYIADMAKRGDQSMLSNINSPYSDTRQTALRLAATEAAKARREMRTADAERLEGIILRRYAMEKEPSIKLCIIRICAPACGPGSTQMVDFLRGRIAAGEFAGHAALSLATLNYKHAAADVIPLTRHPAPEVRYQAATALTIIADPRGINEIARIINNMQSQPWPPVVDGMPLEDARLALAKRARMTFGQAVQFNQ
jgi:hypothetical protein